MMEEARLLIGMDWNNLARMRRMTGGDPDGKCRLLLSFAGREEEIEDPWYTGDFETAYRDIDEGCRGLLAQLSREEEDRG